MKFSFYPIFILCFLVGSPFVQAQNINGTTLDKITNEVIPFVNIGIVGRNVGTTSDNQGRFSLSLESGMDQNTLRFSSIGYESYDILLVDLRRNGLDSIVTLNRAPIDINEVLITSKRLTPHKLGVPKKKCFPIPFYKGVISDVPFPQKAYRHEIGTLFRNDQQTKLDSVQLHFTCAKNDTLDFRVNVYSYDESSVANVLNEPIYIRLSRSKSLASSVIDLSELNLWLEGDFLVTIENYAALSDNSIRVLSNFRSTGRKYPTVYRSSTQSKFEVLKSKSEDFGLSIIAYIKN